MSSLARKVFDQVELEDNFLNAWWVERRLQYMKIIGLVKWIQSSKKKEIEFMDPMAARYSWATRDEEMIIGDHFWVYELVQGLQEDFPWNYWERVVALSVTDLKLLDSAIYIANSVFKGNLPYALAIFDRNKMELISRVEYTKQKVCDNFIPNNGKSVTVNAQNNWEQLKNLI